MPMLNIESFRKKFRRIHRRNLALAKHNIASSNQPIEMAAHKLVGGIQAAFGKKFFERRNPIPEFWQRTSNALERCTQ